MEKLKINPESGLYQFPQSDFSEWPYKHKSITNPEKWAAFLPYHGTVLYIEGKHFEIVD